MTFAIRIGLYAVNIHLGHEIEAELKVWVVPTVTDEEPKPKAQPAKEQSAAKVSTPS